MILSTHYEIERLVEVLPDGTGAWAATGHRSDNESDAQEWLIEFTFKLQPGQTFRIVKVTTWQTRAVVEPQPVRKECLTA